MLHSAGMTHALAQHQANSQCGSVAITYRNYTQYSVETNPPVSFVFELVSDDRLASTAGARILQVMTGGHWWQLESEIRIHAINTWAHTWPCAHQAV